MHLISFHRRWITWSNVGQILSTCQRKQCEADIVNMSMMQRSSSGYEPPADKLYDQPLLGFVRTKNTYTEKQQNQLPQKYKIQRKQPWICNTSAHWRTTRKVKKMVHGTWGIPSWDPRKEKLLGTQEESEGREEGSSQDQEKPKTEKKRRKMAKAKCKR